MRTIYACDQTALLNVVYRIADKKQQSRRHTCDRVSSSPHLTALSTCSAVSGTGAARHRSLRAPRSPVYIHDHDEQQPRLARGRRKLGPEGGPESGPEGGPEGGPVGRARGGRDSR